jgi:hypothetical protein
VTKPDDKHLHRDLSPPASIRPQAQDILRAGYGAEPPVFPDRQRSCVEADLYLEEAVPHGGFDAMMAGTPEDADARADLVRWIARHFD